MKKRVQLKSIRALIGLLCASISLVLCFAHSGSLKAGGAFAVLFLVAGVIDFRGVQLKSVAEKLYILFWFIFTSFVTLFLSQFIQNESVFALPVRQVVLGWICCLIPMLVLFAVTLLFKLSSLLAAGLLLLLSTANQYVYSFRGSELCPTDLLTIGTAINVASKYTYTISGQVLYSWLLFGVFSLFATGLPNVKCKRRMIGRAATLGVLLLSVFLLTTQSKNVTVQHFLHGGSYWNGYLLNFTLEIKESIVRKPTSYSPEAVSKLSGDYESNEKQGRDPDIIVIMDEAYSDLGIVGGGLKTNIPVSPFVDSLCDNTTRGYTLSSVYGGGTPNSEYEFLTGNSLLFVKGIVYQQYLREPSYSLVSVLKNRGYACIAMHPYLDNGWRRNVVWPNLLFDENLFLDAFPQQKLVRGLVSDQEMFEVLLERYEEERAESDQPVFIFGVTMQNHSAYDYAGEDFNNSVELVGYLKEYPEVEQYLSLLHETDQAVEYLLNELKQVERDVIVVFYGDHQPAVSSAFLEEVHGGRFETLEDNQLLQMVPFFIWTNYESKSKEIPLTSLNYLSNYLLDKANIPLPAYNRFLREIESQVPAMNAKGYYSLSGNGFRDLSEAEGEEKEALDRYWLAEYNSLFDLKNLDQTFFPLFHHE